MKTLRKLSLKAMENTLQPLNEEFLKKILGGDGYVSSFDMNGGTVTNWQYGNDRYAVFSSNDGRVIVLEGVHVGNDTLPFQSSDTACYFGGNIRIGSDWDNFDFNDLMHEYGHYLQNQDMSSLLYYYGAAGSVINMATGGDGHSQMPFEQDATNRGNSYAASYYGYPTSY
jgi:hypothetical protein